MQIAQLRAQCPVPGNHFWPAWPPHTEHLVKKLVILKEVVCDQFKMKLNDMVSLIGQFKSILPALMFRVEMENFMVTNLLAFTNIKLMELNI